MVARKRVRTSGLPSAVEPDECPVCLEAMNAEVDHEHFPCGHSTCAACSPRLSRCPICRVDRNGHTQQQQQEQEQREFEQRHDEHHEVLRQLMQQFVNAQHNSDSPVRAIRIVSNDHGTIPPAILRVIESLTHNNNGSTRTFRLDHDDDGPEVGPGGGGQEADSPLNFSVTFV